LSLCNYDPIANIKNEVRNSFDNLQATGVLQPKNKMDIEALLNLSKKLQMVNEVSIEDICQAVLMARNA